MWTSSPTRVIISIRAPVRTNATREIHICSAQIATKKSTNTFLPKNQYYETKKNISARAPFSFRRSDIEDRRLLKLVDFFRVGNCAMRATDDNAEEELIYIVLKFLSLLYAIDLCDVNVA